MSPSDYALIVFGTIGFLALRSLWDWRRSIAAYVAQWRRPATPATATTPVAATATEPLRVIAMGRNDSNAELPRNGSNLVLRAQAELLARLIRSDSLFIADGKGGYKPAGQTALIRLATGLAPNGRADSDYGQLRAELESLLDPQLTIAAGRPEERSIAKV
jgi:hypothetical protein